jgi:hypothetical protein
MLTHYTDRLLTTLQGADPTITGCDGPAAAPIPPGDPTTTLAFNQPVGWWRVTWSAPPSAQQQAAVASVLVTFSTAPTLDEKLAGLEQLAQTLAAVVKAIVAANAAQPALFAAVPSWAIAQIQAANTWVTSQGGQFTAANAETRRKREDLDDGR